MHRNRNFEKASCESVLDLPESGVTLGPGGELELVTPGRGAAGGLRAHEVTN